MLSCQRYALVALLPGMNSGTHFTRGFVVPGSGLDSCAEEDVSCPPPDFELRTFRQIPIRLRWSGLLSRYSNPLRAGRFGDRIQVGTRIPALVQTGPKSYPASCTMGTGAFPVVTGPGRGVAWRGVALNIHPNLAPNLKKE
jgi:hypothetical protein